MKEVDLLIVDDIALRGCPEGFQNELYEIIDCRSTEDTTTIFTSNVTFDELPENCFKNLKNVWKSSNSKG